MTLVDINQATDAEMRNILETTRTIAVVGFSHRESRAGYRIPAYMQRAGYRIIPINPYIGSALGEKAYPDLLEVPEPIDLVNVFRRPEYVPEVVDQAIEIGAQAIWLQLGIWHAKAGQRAREAGLSVVMDACLMVEHRRLLG